MPDYSGFAGNTPLSFGTTGAGSIVNDPLPRGKTDEQKFADALIKHLGQMGMNDGMTVAAFLSKNTAYQMRMMDLITAFLTAWRARYESGYWDDSKELQNLGEMAYRMLESCNGGKHGSGVHHRAPC